MAEWTPESRAGLVKAVEERWPDLLSTHDTRADYDRSRKQMWEQTKALDERLGVARVLLEAFLSEWDAETIEKGRAFIASTGDMEPTDATEGGGDG